MRAQEGLESPGLLILSDENAMRVSRKTSLFQTIWAWLLILAGLGVFIRTFQQGPMLDSVAGNPSTALFIRICFYIMGILLIGGGIKKLYGRFKQPYADKATSDDNSGRRESVDPQ